MDEVKEEEYIREDLYHLTMQFKGKMWNAETKDLLRRCLHNYVATRASVGQVTPPIEIELNPETKHLDVTIGDWPCD